MKCGKHTFPTEAHAKAMISKAWSGHASWRGKPLPVRYYKCNDCNSWHLTSKPYKTIEQLRMEAQARA